MKCVEGYRDCQGPYARSGVTCCYECSMYHEGHPSSLCLCDDCRNKYEVDDPTFISISLVGFTEEFISKVASRAETDIEAIKLYLGDKDRQDNKLFEAFEYYQIFPIGKFRIHTPKPESKKE